MRYLLREGYDVVPVRADSCKEVLGVECVASLDEIDRPVDLVDVFRRVEATPEVARAAVAANAGAVWLQLGLRSPEARAIVEAAGIDYLQDERAGDGNRRLPR